MAHYLNYFEVYFFISITNGKCAFGSVRVVFGKHDSDSPSVVGKQVCGIGDPSDAWEGGGGEKNSGLTVVDTDGITHLHPCSHLRCPRQSRCIPVKNFSSSFS
jgi:hypothetical protein